MRLTEHDIELLTKARKNHKIFQENAKKLNARLTKKQRSDAAKKAWETKRNKYVEKINNAFDKLPSDKRMLWKKTMSDSKVQERIMRLGIEKKMLNLKEEEFEQIAVATLKEDFIKRAGN